MEALQNEYSDSWTRRKPRSLKDMFHGYDYLVYMGNEQIKRIRAIVGGMDFILGKSEEEQKDFKKIAVELAKAHALCAATQIGQEKALEVSYFKAVKASMIKLGTKGNASKSKKEIEARVNQMLERSIISEEVIDVFDALGIQRPEVSILSEEFLEEVRELKQKNLAVEMLRKLLEGNIKSIERTNLVKSEMFSEKLKKSLNKYRNQAITNIEVIEELIRLAHELKKMREEQASLGLSEDEIAFYDALTADNVVKLLMEDKILKQIARELAQTIRNNITVDWSVRKKSQAHMRTIIKRLLKKYKYPPEKAKKAMDIVMKQAEKMCANEVELFYGKKVAETGEFFII
jgi:type I restriction enzyme R subunit